MSEENTVICPYCGSEILREAEACPVCGSDENTGWSGNTYLDGIDLPDEDDYEEILSKEFGSDKRYKTKGLNWRYAIALMMVLLMMFIILRTVCAR